MELPPAKAAHSPPGVPAAAMLLRASISRLLVVHFPGSTGASSADLEHGLPELQGTFAHPISPFSHQPRTSGPPSLCVTFHLPPLVPLHITPTVSRSPIHSSSATHPHSLRDEHTGPFPLPPLRVSLCITPPPIRGHLLACLHRGCRRQPSGP